MRMSEPKPEYVTDAPRIKQYMQYFTFSSDGDLYVRTDFRERLGELKGSDLTALLLIMFGDDNKELLMQSFENGKSIFNKRISLKKEKIPSEVRWSVWERDNFTCKHCGTRRNLSIDHIIPESKGGQTTIENCQTLCKTCNSKKGAR